MVFVLLWLVLTFLSMVDSESKEVATIIQSQLEQQTLLFSSK
jgi:hypothetical protein